MGMFYCERGDHYCDSQDDIYHRIGDEDVCEAHMTDAEREAKP